MSNNKPNIIITKFDYHSGDNASVVKQITHTKKEQVSLYLLNTLFLKKKYLFFDGNCEQEYNEQFKTLFSYLKRLSSFYDNQKIFEKSLADLCYDISSELLSDYSSVLTDDIRAGHTLLDLTIIQDGSYIDIDKYLNITEKEVLDYLMKSENMLDSYYAHNLLLQTIKEKDLLYDCFCHITNNESDINCYVDFTIQSNKDTLFIKNMSYINEEEKSILNEFKKDNVLLTFENKNELTLILNKLKGIK